MEKEQKTEVKQEAKADEKVVKAPIMVERETYEKNEKNVLYIFHPRQGTRQKYPRERSTARRRRVQGVGYRF